VEQAYPQAAIRNAEGDSASTSGLGNPHLLFRVLLIVLAGGIYLLTMAPGVMTDDSAEFQVRCVLLESTHPPGYPLLLLLGKVFAQIPLSTIAWRLTLMSVFFGVLAVVFLYETIALLVGSAWVAFAAAMTFVLSHTFWMESLLPEAYSLNAAFNAIILYLLARYQQRPSEQAAIIPAVAFLTAFAAGNHQVIVLMTPVYLLWFRRCDRSRAFTWRRILAAAVAFVIGASVYLVLTMRMGSLAASIDLALGGPSRGLLFVFTPLQVVKRFLIFLGYHAYQFPLIAGVAGIIGWVWAMRRNRSWWALTMALWAITAVYAVNFDSSDVYVFYIPAYIAFAVWVGFGFRFVYRLTGGQPISAASLLMIAALVTPPFFYGWTHTFVTSQLRKTLSADKGNRYYLYPPKQDAGWFGSRMRHLLATASAGDAVLTDWNYYFTARYFRQIERLRTDLSIHDVTPMDAKDLKPLQTTRALMAEGLDAVFTPNFDLATIPDAGMVRGLHTVGWFVARDRNLPAHMGRRALAAGGVRKAVPSIWKAYSDIPERRRPSDFRMAEGRTFLAGNIPACREASKPVHIMAETDRVIRGQGIWMAIENVRDLIPCDGWVEEGEVGNLRNPFGKTVSFSFVFWKAEPRGGGRDLGRNRFTLRRPLHGAGGGFDDTAYVFQYLGPGDDRRALPEPVFPTVAQPNFLGNAFYVYAVIPETIEPGSYNLLVNMTMGTSEAGLSGQWGHVFSPVFQLAVEE
jgi:hypothetical protein